MTTEAWSAVNQLRERQTEGTTEMLKPIIAAACMWAAAAAMPVQAASVVGGSFENPDIGPFGLAFAPSADFVGDTGLYSDGVLGGVADGTQAAFLRSFLDGDQDGLSRITLDVIDLLPGAMYTVSYFGAQLDLDPRFFGGRVRFESADRLFSQNIGFFQFRSTEFTQFETRAFTAPSTSGRLFFNVDFIANLSGPSRALSGIDAITINEVMAGAVPEPSTWAMLIVGFGLLGGAVRRRRPALLATA